MNLVLEHVNTLPARTWNRINMNDTTIHAQIPEIRPYPQDGVISEIPAGVSVSFNFDKSGLQPLEIETGMGTAAQEFVAAHHNSGAYIRIAAGTHAEKPLYLTYHIDQDHPAVVDENTIIAEEDSELTVVMSYSSDDTFSGFHGGETIITAGKNAVVHLIQVQLLNSNCCHFDDVGAVTAENAEINIVQAELGGQNALAGCKVLLDGADSRLNIDSIYFGDHSRTIDMNYVAKHIGKRTKSEIHLSGALLNESQKVFRGTIDFVKGAVNAVGHESEYNLLFSPKVKSRTAPLILCGEENVEGQHAASTGRIDAEKLFYLMSRGLSEFDAKKLMIEAQFEPATQKIPDDDLRAAISDYVKKGLNQIESIS